MENMEEDSSRAPLLWPDPPPFWKDFTPDNIASFDRLKHDYAQQQGLDDSDVLLRILDLPEYLLDLQPPREPEERKWRLFSVVHSLNDELQSLEAMGIQRLGPLNERDRDGKHMDRAFELKRQAKSILLNFLELMGVMSYNPSHGAEKVKDLDTLLLNFQHILNEYRPHQAREQLIQLMQDQLDNKRAETAAVRGVVDKAKRALEGLGSMEIPPPTTPERESSSMMKASELGDGVKDGVPHWERQNIDFALLDGDFV
ncbi:MED7 protein-domain-containing protein [Lasiosphaeria miniovina]|uniref:Mediator of RNA polymerase II transcription subunit 7 n=1 Tax=Lasiosphaeria miniovina TaxID=1954250 RepID=A0AA40A6L0_9PEZI|nr:MED7 protein-domain-containing protein [Lasiosphaeria miniovina]KAK0710101.1 MED7 protein-domain-containing protein [Lasiosphaeria miniovina]